MLSKVIIEGLFTGVKWNYNTDLFFRLACYRDPHRPAKYKDNREQPDYVTIRMPAAGVPIVLSKGAVYRIEGFLQSREYQESLGDFIKNAHGPTNMLTVGDELKKQVTHNRVATEIVAELITLVQQPPNSATAGKRSNGAKAEAANQGQHKAPAVVERALVAEATAAIS